MNAIIFPGQGAQYPGMGKSLYEGCPLSKDIFHSIDAILGFELSKKCFEAEADELQNTSLQQLAILTVSLAAYEAFKDKNIKVDYLAGLSLGECSCLYAARVISLENLVGLVKLRALAMERAAQKKPTTMLAVIGAERKVLEDKAKKSDFYIANINSPKQIVISLAKENKEKVLEDLIPIAARVVELQVSGGFHSPFMAQAKKDLGEAIRGIEFQDAEIPIVSNFTARFCIKSEDIKINLLEQLTSPVLWCDCVEFMAKEGVDLLFELGPGKVLRGLVRRINPQLRVVNVEKKEDLDEL